VVSEIATEQLSERVDAIEDGDVQGDLEPELSGVDLAGDAAVGPRGAHDPESGRLDLRPSSPAWASVRCLALAPLPPTRLRLLWCGEMCLMKHIGR
jgi:hypothetical protein